MKKAKEFVRNFCCEEIRELIQVKFLLIRKMSCSFMFFFCPLQDYPLHKNMVNDRRWKKETRLRVIAISSNQLRGFGCLVEGEGECTGQIQLKHILKSSESAKKKDIAGK